MTTTVMTTPRAASRTGRGQVLGRAERDYIHLEPLLDVYAATPPHDPCRRELRERLVLGYLPVARNVAHRYSGRGEPLDDLEQVASIGLLKAIDGYRPEFDIPFLGFAIPAITWEIQRHFRDRAWAIRVPRRLQDLQVLINQAITELSHHLNRTPRPSDIATWLGISVQEVLDGLHAAQAYRARPLHQLLGTGEATVVSVDGVGADETGLERFIASRAVAPHLAGLPKRERSILIMRFYDELSQTQIAAKLGLSQMHISRLLAKTLAQLRHAVEHDEPPPGPDADHPQRTRPGLEAPV